MISEWHKGPNSKVKYSISPNKKIGRPAQKPKGDLEALERLLRAGSSYHKALRETGVSTHTGGLLKRRLEAEGVKITKLTAGGRKFA